jgi:hypothetical protein
MDAEDIINAGPPVEESSVQIAASAPVVEAAAPGDPDYSVIELGDRVKIITTRYGTLTGTVYYRSEELISVMPDGESNRLRDFALTDTGEFQPEYEITEVKIPIGGKHTVEGFVNQNNLRAGQILEAFDADGRIARYYKVVGANAEEDWIDIQPLAAEPRAGEEPVEDGDVERVDFDYTGIPRDQDFVILHPREMRELEEEPAAEAVEDEALHEDFEAPQIVEGITFTGTVVVPEFIELEEIPETEHTYSDYVQKSDALQDFLEMMTDKQRKNPAELRKVRAVTEMFNGLKLETVQYSDDSEYKRPIGMKPTTPGTLIDLFAEQNVPLGRPVLETTKYAYNVETKTSEKAAAEEADDNSIPGILKKSWSTELANWREALKMDVAGPNAPGAAASRTAFTEGYWIYLTNYLNRYARSWDATITDADQWQTKGDTEFFRMEIPNFKTNPVPGIAIETSAGPFGRPQSTLVSRTIPFAIDRAVGATFRASKQHRLELLLVGEYAPVSSYVLFPLLATPVLGSKRSGLLARDVEYSHRAFMTLKQLIMALGEIEDMPSSNKILALGKDGNTLGNIPVADYLRGIKFGALGPGGFDLIMRQFGLDKYEYSKEMYEVLQAKMASAQNALQVYINTLRSELEEFSSSNPTPAYVPLFGDSFKEGQEVTKIAPLEAARSNPMLQNVLRDLELSAPMMADSDLAQIIALIKHQPDLFLAIAGGQAATVASEQFKARRSAFIKSLESAMRLRILMLNKGEAPVPNTCKHVEVLTKVRRIDDDAERMAAFLKFIAKYQGGRDENWINCNVCKKHLVCLHEMLMAKMKFNPREKDTFNKELLLKFNGPLVSGLYQCRNCGQPIRELAYDTNLEFDDEGRPMMGRAVLEEEKALEMDEVAEILATAMGQSTNNTEVFKDPEDKLLYLILRQITDRLSIRIPRERIEKILEGVKSIISRQPSREAYNQKIKKALETRGEDSKRADIIDYDTRISRMQIGAVGAFVLLEVQTAIPGYMVYATIPGCKPSFAGYPLGATEDTTGIEYMACVISSVRPADVKMEQGMPHQSPFALSKWHDFADDTRRITRIKMQLETVLETYVMRMPIAIHAVMSKRSYIREVYGTAGNMDSADRIQDSIPAGFLPRQVVITPEEAAKDPVVAESANATAAADLYIQIGHRQAIKTGRIARGNPFAETTCCPAPLEDPQAYWRSVDGLPKLPRRTIRSAITGTRMMQHFAPRHMKVLTAEAPENLYYRMFLNVCASGPNIGRPHELGFSHKCTHCKFQFPESLFSVKDYIQTTGMDKAQAAKEKAARDEELRIAQQEANAMFAEQGIDITPEFFQKVLDASHLANSVDPFTMPEAISPYERIAQLATLDPPPSPNWISQDPDRKGVLNRIIEGVVTLSRNGQENSGGELENSVGEIATASREAKKYIERMVSTYLPERSRDEEKFTKFFEGFLEQEPHDFKEILMSHIIVPAQRLLTQCQPATFTRVSETLQLSLEHYNSLQTMLNSNQDVYTTFRERFSEQGSAKHKLARVKLTYYVQQLTAIYKGILELNPENVPGGEPVLRYLLKYFFLQCTADLINPNEAPPDAPPASRYDTSSSLLVTLVIALMNQYGKERISLDTEEIRNLIQARIEQETELFIDTVKRMTDDEKQLDAIQKNLRMGRYAVGGSTVIYKYDAARWDQEQKERILMGMAGSAGVEGISLENLESMIGRGDEGYMDNGQGYEIGQMGAGEGEDE